MGEDTTMNEVLATPRGDSAPPRLIIKKMELENFKSYAGVREIGPFHKCFSSVVGPNGSGKSNVIDAMLFVFGKRAKKLRLNKVRELIHKSDAVKDDPPTSARVSVYFHEIVDTGPGDEDYNVVPGSECVVTRIARQDNSSNYKLDGKNCQFKEVAAYLESKGIDLDNNRFLILQGEVEMISMMPPKGKTENDEGLLEYLEDIIGSSKYVEETNHAAEKLEQLSEVRQEKLNRVKAVEKEKENLQAAKLEAEALLGKERDIRRKQNVLYQIHTWHCHQEMQSIESKKLKAQTKLDAERKRLTDSSQRIQEIEDGMSEQKAEYDRVYVELVKTKEEFASYERRDIKLREEIKYNKTQKKKLEAKVEAEANKEQGASQKGADAEESIPKWETKIVELTEQKTKEDTKLEQMYEATKGETVSLRAQLEEVNHKLVPIQQERAVFQAALDTAQTEVELLENATIRAREKLATSESELASLDETQRTKREELVACEEELQQAKDRIEEALQEDMVLAEKEVQLGKRNKDLLARSEEAKAALQSKVGGRSPVVQAILKAARKGGELANVGVLGRLGDLATIAEEYDVAVSTACSLLDHIVVQTTAGAQKCIEFLRKHGIGRANFVALDKLKKGAHDRVVETPEGAPRLFELIAPANFSITPAIFLAVGDTLVASDLETATRWAYDYGKRWRVVTLDGKLIETSGAMSGGGKAVRRGGMKLANAKKSNAVQVEEDIETMDCKNLEDEAEKAAALLQQVRNRRKGLVEEVRNLKKRVKTLETKLPKLSLEIGGFDTTRDNLTKSIPELRIQSELSKSDASKLVELNKKVAKCKSDMSACAMKASKLEGEVARIQQAILDVGGPRYKKQKELCDEILTNLNNAEKSLNMATVTVTTSRKAANKARETRVNVEKQLEECEQTLNEKKAEFKALEEDAMKVMQAFEEVKAIEAEKREALDSIYKEIEELKKSQSNVKVAEIELAGQIDSFNKQMGECEKKAHHWNKELDRIRKAAMEDDDFDLSDDEEQDDETKGDGDKADNDTEMEESDAVSDGADQEAPTKQPFERKDSLPVLSPKILEKYDKDVIKEEITILETERNTIAKNANMGAIEEYRKKEADYLSRVAELDEVTEERNIVRKTHEELRRKRLEMFMDGFGQITLKLKEMYQMITLGGDAELELVDSLDPFSEGIVFSVRPPKKSWKNISNLSGGEKTLSSLALVFALHHFKPTPLYVMDEIDAALDFKNVSIVANYIKERTKNAQFIIISLRNNMFELADRLVGIYKTNNCTKSVTINPRAFGVDVDPNGQTRTPAALSEKTNSNTVSSSMKQSIQRRISLQSEHSDV